MKKNLKAALICLVLFASLTACATPAPAQTTPPQTTPAQTTAIKDSLYQVSTLSALMQGVYDGEITLSELTKRGDFGIGTFHALDGEMVVLDGKVYQVLASGKVVQPDLSLKTPFAMVTAFNADIKKTTGEVANFDKLKATLDSMLPSKNQIYAIKVSGTFSYIKTRSVAAQKEPYPILADVTASQAVFEYKNVKGTLVGYWCPEYLSGVNLAGFHLHFLSDDRTMGGHLLESSAINAEISIDTLSQFQMLLPQNKHFLQTDFSGVTEKDKQKVEK
jgi:acetolactate decarboxylase